MKNNQSFQKFKEILTATHIIKQRLSAGPVLLTHLLHQQVFKKCPYLKD